MDQGLGPAMTARAEKKRAQILDGARAVFLAEGFDGASMEAIAHAAGVSKGTLYTHFKGKDELFASLIAACQNRSLEETFRTLNKASDPRRNLETLARNYLDRVREPENLALLRGMLRFDSSNREITRISVGFGTMHALHVQEHRVVPWRRSDRHAPSRSSAEGS